MITVLGGVEIEVEHRDGSKETVLVRQLPVKDMQRFWSGLNNEAASIELVCERPEGWHEKLKPESYQALADKAQEINLPFFRPWVRRQIRWQEAASPGVIEGVKAAIDLALEKVSHSPGSSQQ